MKVLVALQRVLGAKFKIVMIIAIPFLLLSVVAIGYGGFSLVRNIFFTEPGIGPVTIDVQEEVIREVFQVAVLEIESSKTAVQEIIPGGFINPGVVTFILEYESTVVFGVRNADQIKMRRIGDVVFVDESSINIEVTSASVRNFQRTHTFRSNPLVRINLNVLDQIFVAQSAYEEVAAERLNNEQNIEAARRHFRLTFEAVLGGLDLTVVWE